MWTCILFIFYTALIVVGSQGPQYGSSLLGSYGDAIPGCDHLNRTSYLRSDKMRIQELPRSAIKAVTLNQCAKHCSSKSSAVDCHSFEYNAASQMCSLQSAQGQPFGPSIVVNTNEPGVAFFQQICIASEELCAAPYSFERFPQRVLLGQSLQVVSADGLSDCLSICLEAKRKLKVDCRSLMFYYETGECVLNRETKKDLPQAFSNDTKFQLVDYFENNCYDVTCYGNFNVHWIRAEDFYVGIEKDVIMNDLSNEECRQACIENMVGAETFPCKAFVYSSAKRECHLTAESGLVRKMMTDPEHDQGEAKNQLRAELSAISAGQYFEKFCIDGPKCKESSFELIADRMLDAFDKVVETKSVAYCLQLCLMDAAQCNSVMFFKDKNECVINKKSQFSDPDIFRPMVNVDYYDNICEYESDGISVAAGTDPPPISQSVDENVLPVGVDIEQAVLKFQEESAERSAEKLRKRVFVPDTSAPVEKIKGTLETECRLDKIVVTAKFENPNSGALFIKDHSSTCRSIFTDTLDSQLEIPFPSSVDSNPDCPGVELAPNLWSFIIVIQKNDIGIPSLMTESDRVFNVTCDYSNTAVTSSQHDTNRPSEFFVTSSAADEYIGKIKMFILRDQEPVTTVSLGEELEMKWIIENVNDEEGKQKLGYFIDECVAERLDGLPPDPAPLRLIYQGCPDKRVRNRLMRYPIVEVSDGYSTHMKAFRFDGSRRVRIRCAVNICVDKCRPVTCESDRNFSSVLSLGRKKRQTVKDLKELLKRYHDAKISGDVLLGDEPDEDSEGSMVEQSTITGTYTIIEGNTQAAEAKGNNESKTSLPLDFEASTPSTVTELGKLLEGETSTRSSADNNGCHGLLKDPVENQICVVRAGFTFLLVSISLLATLQLLILFRCLYGRCNHKNSFFDENASLDSACSVTPLGATEFYNAYFERQNKDRSTHSTSFSSASPKGSFCSNSRFQEDPAPNRQTSAIDHLSKRICARPSPVTVVRYKI